MEILNELTLSQSNLLCEIIQLANDTSSDTITVDSTYGDLTIRKEILSQNISFISIALDEIVNYTNDHEICRKLLLLEKSSIDIRPTRFWMIDFEYQENYETVDETVTTHYHINYKREKLFYSHGNPEYRTETVAAELDSFLHDALSVINTSQSKVYV